MKAACSKCGQPWNVSVHKKLNKPYVCPRCSKVKKMVLTAVGFIICCVAVPKLNRIVNVQRGYSAGGGEVLIPLLYLVVVGFIKTVLDYKKENAHQ
ncbi:hypothetical protein [Ruminiclostridium cellulolyticum]|uniref:Uncharacterized protein n=1 Tax=Ruminiclostridium cellulolyticum (strain ATCC 35319 / DSM 5812 / JCM 6584 / H10) TaxID=394503 RepID=B8I144_RUMCH|nr:hypothetical protein [Ruminiclostridium cellulolyticum]ACL77361.1 hypothetical protein Ccel_3069 [Ruminiclostridium cellulolyticum H10]ACL77600.1 hypothetical protein Ccel_3311 [Ruminiclostridium cellulolyticum H10]